MRAIITGGTKGIGRAIVNIFAKAGYDLAVCARTNKDVKELEASLKSDFPDLDLIVEAVDMSDKESVKHFGQQVLKKWNKVDVLINNVGVFIPGKSTEEAEGQLEIQMNTNLYSAYYMTRSVLSAMLLHKSGHIFNMCSVASLYAYEFGGSYSISKFALLGFTKVLREELKEQNIKVTAVLPGITWSAAWEGATIPKDRLLQPEEVAKAILNVAQMGKGTVIEELLIRPQLGDL